MAKKRKKVKLRLSRAERKRRSLQAKRNCGLIKKRRTSRKIKRRRSRSPRRKARRKSKIKTRSVNVMARRRRFRSRGSGGTNINRAMTGAAIVAVADPILDSLIDKFAGQLGGQLNGIDVKDILKTGAGWWMARRGRGVMLKSAGFAWAVIGVNNIVKGATQGLIKV